MASVFIEAGEVVVKAAELDELRTKAAKYDELMAAKVPRPTLTSNKDVPHSSAKDK